jgi:predicted amidohydrolase YtcJ
MSPPRAFAVDNRKQAYIIPVVSRSTAQDFSPASDLAILNGRLWTGNKSQPIVQALACRGERIVAVGSNDDVKKIIGPKTRIVDLQGKLALPGFIDSHTHFVEAGFHLLSVDLRDAPAPEEFARRIGNHAAKLPAGSWITGGDWDHERWPGAALPTKELIDVLTLEHPVFVSRLDGHMGLANSAALRRAVITRESADPPGGKIVRDPNTGEPTGILKDDAQSLVFRVIPEHSDAIRDAALKASLAEASRFGVTSIQDITPWHDYDAFKRFRDAKLLTVRVYARTPMSQWKRRPTRWRVKARAMTGCGSAGSKPSWMVRSGLRPLCSSNRLTMLLTLQV